MGGAAEEFFDDGLTGQMELGGGEVDCSPDLIGGQMGRVLTVESV